MEVELPSGVRDCGAKPMWMMHGVRRILAYREPVDLRKSFRTPGEARRLQQVQFLPRQEGEPPHRESSLGLMEVTT